MDHRKEEGGEGLVYPYQNFSVFVPGGVARGRGVVSVALFVLLGVSVFRFSGEEWGVSTSEC